MDERWADISTGSSFGRNPDVSFCWSGVFVLVKFRIHPCGVLFRQKIAGIRGVFSKWSLFLGDRCSLLTRRESHINDHKRQGEAEDDPQSDSGIEDGSSERERRKKGGSQNIKPDEKA